MNLSSLRIRTLLAVLLMLVVLVGVLLFVADSIIESGFRAVEERNVAERVEQSVNALNDSIADLNRTARDYAVWDDSYAFVSGALPSYIEDNLADATFIYNNLSYIAFIDSGGNPAYMRAFDLTAQEETPLPAELSRFDGSYAPLLQHTAIANQVAGVIVLADGPLLIAAQPILTSQGEGPPVGTLLMGRRLDERELARLSEVTRLPIQLSRLDDPTLSPRLQQVAAAISAEQPVVATTLDSRRISGASYIADLGGGPGLLLEIELPRDVYQLGQEATRQYTLALLGAGLLFGALIFWLLERTVLRRIISLAGQVAAVDATRPEARLMIKGGDEIGRLGNAINAMLDRLVYAQQQIVANEKRYRQLIELSPDAIIIHNGAQIHYINSAGARLLGSGMSETYIGQPLDPTIGLIAPREDGAPVLCDRILTRPDGEAIEVELVVLPFQDRDTRATQAIVRNISERKEVERALRTAKESADAANRAKSQFLSTMSHELRTPLTAIIGYAELLERTLAATATNNVRRDLDRIRVAGNQLLAIINDVLDLSKIEAGRIQIRPARLVIAPLVQAIVDTVRPIAEQNGNQLIMDGLDTAGSLVTDEVRLRQILVNLAGNACKFTSEGTITVQLIEQPAADAAGPDLVHFVVRDTGIGMRPEQLALLFQDFVQIDASTTRKYGGTGLGLALSRRLARLLGGDISVESELGVGSTFTLTLPRTFAAQVTQESIDLQQAPVLEPAAPATSLPETGAGETKIVLVIDDDPTIRDLLPRVLAHPGLQFETAANGIEGLDLAAALLPDLIILDVLLPELDGWSVLRRLKEDPETSAIPVLMQTIDHDAQRGFVLGAAGFLHKPVDTNQLAQEILRILKGNTAPQHVLLVEDDDDLRSYFRRTLERGGWIVSEAADGPTALAQLDQQRPALAIIDLMLPGMDGITLIGTIRARPDGATLPIVVVTAKDLTLEEQAQLNRSVEQVLHKGSFRSDDFLRIIWGLVQSNASISAQAG